MKSGRSYRYYDGPEAYDAIVVGSGMGGLTVAAFLARKGKRVLVLERHYTAGGFTHVFKRRDYEWDVGIHYLGEVHVPETEPAQIFRYITDGKLKFAPMPDPYDRLIFPDRDYALRKGIDNFRADLRDWFPKEGTAIDRYIELMGAATGPSSVGYFAEKAMPGFVAKVAGGWMRAKHLRLASRTTRSVLDELSSDMRLKGVLTGQYGDHGLPPGQSSFAIHCMVAAHYQKGASYPVGGSSRIAESIVPVIEAAGGAVLVRAEVAQILVERGKATGVRMVDGREFRAGLVISDAGFVNTFYQLVPGNGVPPLADLGLEPSVGHFCLYIGLKGDREELKLPTNNLWIYPGYDHDASMGAYLDDPDAALPLTYISFPSTKDPEWADRYPGRSTIEIITVAPYAWLRQWENGKWRNRGMDYDAYKEKISARMLEMLYAQLPHLRGKVDCHELSTPLSTRHFANYQQGELYGLAHTPARFASRMLRARTHVKNLYLTGQDVVTCGVAGALYAGVLTASAIAVRNVMGEAFKWCRENPGQ